MTSSAFSKKITEIGIRKALNLSKSLANNWTPEDMEFLVSRWSTESHTFIVWWGEFCPTTEDVIVLTGPLFGETRTVKLLDDSEEIVLNRESDRKLEALNKALNKTLTDPKSRPKAYILHG